MKNLTFTFINFSKTESSDIITVLYIPPTHESSYSKSMENSLNMKLQFIKHPSVSMIFED